MRVDYISATAVKYFLKNDASLVLQQKIKMTMAVMMVIELKRSIYF